MTCHRKRGGRDQSGALNPNWRNGRRKHQGYIQIRIEEGKYAFEHHLVMEAHIGRKLVKGENVHHKNGVRDDNRVENLELWRKPQPTGIRAKNALEWARSIVTLYEAIEEFL